MRGKMPVKDYYKANMKKIICFAFLLILLLPSCSQKPSRYSVTYTDVFDTVTEISAYVTSKEAFEAAANAAHDELLRLHKLFDIYNEYDGITNLAALNRLCKEGKQNIDPDIENLIKTGLQYANLTNGRLNIAAGAVLRLWKQCRDDSYGVPNDELLKFSGEHIDYNAVVIENGAMYFTDKEILLDVGSIAKGYAADRAAAVMKDYGVTDFLINAGGNVVSSGKKPDGDWVIGIQDPDKSDGIYTKIKAPDKAVVTSGDYQRYYEYNGERYSHIIDMETLYPARSYRSVTVICSSSVDADALSTSLFCMSLEAGKTLAMRLSAEVLWIMPDGSACKTEGFSAYE